MAQTKRSRRGLKALRFDVVKMVQDCGGIYAIEGRTKICRTQFYRMARNGSFNVQKLCKIKAAFPINIDDYFVEVENVGNEASG